MIANYRPRACRAVRLEKDFCPRPQGADADRLNGNIRQAFRARANASGCSRELPRGRAKEAQETLMEAAAHPALGESQRDWSLCIPRAESGPRIGRQFHDETRRT